MKQVKVYDVEYWDGSQWVTSSTSCTRSGAERDINALHRNTPGDIKTRANGRTIGDF
jgi:hypothetical protein